MASTAREKMDFTWAETYFQALTAADHFSGTVLVTRGAETLFSGAYGLASRAWRIANTLDTRFDTASVTKLFTAVAALQLSAQGRLSLDTRAVEYLGLQQTAISPDATLYHLLTHTSGIGDDADEENGESYEALWVQRPNYSVTRAADFLPQFAHKPANFTPGQGCRYCNCAYVLAGMMMEKASGMEYRDFVRQNIFSPAGMTDSGFFHMGEVNERVAEGCIPLEGADGNLRGWRRNIYSYPPIGAPDGGAYVTAGDLTRFLRAVQAGQLLSPALTTAFLTPQVFYRAGKQWQVHYGYGLVFYLDDAEQVVSYHKEGINVGVSGMLRYFPAQEITVVLLSTLSEGVWAPMGQIHELIVGMAKGHS